MILLKKATGRVKCMKKNLIDYKMKLTGKYLSQFEIIEQIIECSDSMYDKKEECLEEILDLLLTAQENGRLPEEVIGKDMRTFCNNILKGINYHTIVYLISVRLFVITLTALIIGISLMALCNVLGNQGTVVVGNKISIIYTYGIAATAGLLDLFIDYCFRNQIVQNGKNKYMKHKGKIRLILVVLSSIFVGLIEENFGRIYTTLPRMLLIVMITLILAVVINVLERRGVLNVLYENTYNKSKNRELIKTGLNRKYEKNNKKNIELSIDSFLEKQQKEIKIGHIMHCMLFPFIIGEVCMCGYLILAKELTGIIIALFVLALVILVINIKFILLKNKQLELLMEFHDEYIENQNKQ